MATVPAAPLAVGFGTPFAAQIDFLRQKLRVPTERWDDIASAAQPLGQSSTSMPAASSPERAASGARQSSGAGMSGTNAGTMGSGRADTRSSTSSPGMRAPKADRN